MHFGPGRGHIVAACRDTGTLFVLDPVRERATRIRVEAARTASGSPSSRSLPHVLEAGDSVPDVRVWTAPREESQALAEVLGDGLSLLCFYVWDWSPT